MTETAGADEDGYLWLEELDGERAAHWVQDRNAESVAALTAGSRFDGLVGELRQVLDAADRIPYPVWRGEHLYNFWKDERHPRGLWRRTTLDQYRRPEPDWEPVLDLDALAEREAENWVWQGATVLRPGYRRALVSLSRGGSDATVVREFDLVERDFVADGFALPEAKTDVGWIDFDHVYVGTDFGSGTLTESGYPRLVKRWRRGTPLAEATVVYEGRAEDVSVFAVHDPTPGFARDFVGRWLDFFRSEQYLRTGSGDLVRIDVPDDAQIDTHRDWLLIRLRSAWTVGGTSYPAGALLVTGLDAFLAGRRELHVVFEPDGRTSLRSHAWTRNHLILALLTDVRSRLEVLTPDGRGWRRRPLAGAPGFDHTDIVATNPDHDDDYLLSSSGFTHPATLRHGRLDAPDGAGAVERAEVVERTPGEEEILKREPDCFDASGLAVRQHFANSADGTRVPYFVVGRPGAPAGPTLLSAYGGFEYSWTPGYSGIVGRGWLARGGTYAVANIRGGGEYGPEWHRCAIRENRLRAYEDFAAVATDLVRRGVTVPAQLGIEGGSNGGLLTGVMLTRYPELFGAVVSQVPLLDMRRYHRLLAGASWMAEYGDPDRAEDWAYLREYSPYHNVRAGRPYPPVLFVTSTRDDRVHPGHARKMVARLREHGYDVTYFENVEGGHGAAADNAQLAFKWALILEFLRRHLVPAA
ncbi:prolyl oligopeptidase family serine peptidase [Micromonospora sp. NPDC049559]|uniref:prolyl oligopeptidase family serine peptidase n=1 Tax=Micromonospora sp. NPDC049559 TaxID=3155923 RepID=UPI0034139241